MKYTLLVTALIGLPALASTSLTISCAEYGSDRYTYGAKVTDTLLTYNENHNGNVTKGSSKVVSIEQKPNYLRFVTEERGFNSVSKNVYELKGKVLTMHSVSTQDGEVVFSGGGQMSNACVFF
ncbi:hypothetical protein VV99796_01608 [Vibrio vulnificus]|uniref:hypothetical protein n=1 Tax=Vibrio vulnificus TaxID=672 RepID=UPI00092B3A1D|nr:hypothetical protein [Vibrio vulnificus]EHT4942416.1 hypothetical protein [Vibrio vulnificus]EID4342672.1 hypothetical protein [Vibrio vulnificus]OJI28152.1 hypothetical protein VV99796_01608 [Vibrio vulnificus]OJI49766.1 hypothetical protein VVS316_01424 [Vibrio vulnificus]POB03268.1 hypothetical protein CRN33_19195 [Vibrio vulnificus]